MAELSGRLEGSGRVAIVVSRYHERITARLLEGARACCRQAGLADDELDVLWVPGTFELGVTADVAATSGRYRVVVALGVVIRGETPHFEYVAGEAARALGEVARRHGTPVGFGVLTVESVAQAEDRAGGAHGNKGFEAAEAALRTADLLDQLRSR